MKLKTIKPFICKLTGVHYNSADFYESDDQERISFLQDEGYLGEEVHDEPEDKVKVKKVKQKSSSEE